MSKPNEENPQRVLLAGVWEEGDTAFDSRMQELQELAEACELQVQGRVIQRLPRIQSASYFGSGRLRELADICAAEQADAIVVLHECSLAQLRNMERILPCRVIDRTLLILLIFERRAHTKEARLQVEMAFCQYELPRLTGAHTDLSRQGGGRNKGRGEQQRQLDKRQLQRRIIQLRQALAQLQTKQQIQQRSRQRSALLRIALVGYTNAGKSTLLNQLLKRMGTKTKQVLAKDQLFATLDTNVRLIQISGHEPFLLSDTVGFLHDLPHTLIQAFAATLAEAKEADLLLHVIDASDARMQEQREVTIQTLAQIGCEQIPRLEIYNKIDCCEGLCPGRQDTRVYLSARDEGQMEWLLTALDDHIRLQKLTLTWFFPYGQMAECYRLRALASNWREQPREEGVLVQAQIAAHRRSLFQAYEKTDALLGE